MEELEFKKGTLIRNKKPIKWSSDRGYYFKGELLDLYKSISLDILRARIENAGKLKGFTGLQAFIEGGIILRDEHIVIMEHNLKVKEQNAETQEKKQTYYHMLKVEARKKKIKKLEEELKELKNE